MRPIEIKNPLLTYLGENKFKNAIKLASSPILTLVVANINVVVMKKTYASGMDTSEAFIIYGFIEFGF